MATASQKIIEIKFFVLMRGAFTPAPTMLVPVVCIPLKNYIFLESNENYRSIESGNFKFYQKYRTIFKRTSNMLIKAF